VEGVLLGVFLRAGGVQALIVGLDLDLQRLGQFVDRLVVQVAVVLHVGERHLGVGGHDAQRPLWGDAFLPHVLRRGQDFLPDLQDRVVLRGLAENVLDGELGFLSVLGHLIFPVSWRWRCSAWMVRMTERMS